MRADYPEQASDPLASREYVARVVGGQIPIFRRLRIKASTSEEIIMVKFKAVAITLMGASALVLSGCSSSAAPDDFSVVSGKPNLTQVDTGTSGSSVGDYSVFNAAVTQDGQPFGVLYGQKLLVAEPGQDGAPEGLGRYQNHLEFDLPDGTITVTGLQYYTVDGSIPDIALSEGEDRAIVGGTGAYAGAQGVLRSTTNVDGTRTQSFDFN